jgi:hypothetical protein
VFIRHAGVALVPDGSFGRIALDVTLSDPVDGTATVTIAGLGLSVPVPIVAGTGRCVVDAQPTLWSPENPQLNDVVTTFGDDRVTDRVGFREIRRDGHAILLNGEPLWLRGVCVHEDDVTVGKVATEEDLRRRFADARDLGDRKHVELRIGQRLGVVAAGARVGRAAEIFRIRRIHEAAFDPHLAHRVGEQVPRAAVEIGRRHEIVTRLADVLHREERRRLPGSQRQRRRAAFELRDALRSRKALVLLVLYVAGAGAGTGIFVRVLGAIETALARTLQVAATVAGRRR